MTMPSSTPELQVDGELLLLDGQHYPLWGLRTANQLEDDAHVQELIKHLDIYLDHGVNAVAPFLQGGNGGTTNAFLPNGDLDERVMGRLVSLLEETARRRMVVVVGFFYVERAHRLESTKAVERAVAQVTDRLRPYRNVIFNLVNEFHLPDFDKTAFPFRQPDGIKRLLDIVRSIDPERLAGANCNDPALAMQVARHTPLVLHDSHTLADYLLFVERIGKPVIDVECGNHALDAGRHGVFSEGAKMFYEQQIASAAIIPGKSIFFHAHWVQGPPTKWPGLRNIYSRHCDLGGYGTIVDPGMRWYFEAVRAARQNPFPEALGRIRAAIRAQNSLALE
jgi:hypothetical protein